MGIITIIILPIIIIFVVLMTCKFFNFSILPDDLRLPAPQKFVMPKLKRNKHTYTWEVDDSSESDEEESSSSLSDEELLDEDDESSSDEDEFSL